MSIEVNDGMFILAPKPADEKIIVGPGAFVKFAQLDDIPESYRYSGMLVYDNNVGVKASFRLDDDLITWVQVLGIHDIFAGVGMIIDKTDIYNPVISAIPGSSAGIFGYSYFTGDQETVPAGTFYKTQRTTKGTVPAITPQQTVSSDGAIEWFPIDYIGTITVGDTLIAAGDYSGVITIGTSNTFYDQQFYLEYYKTDIDGNPVDSGITSAPVGSYGVRVVSILTTGIVHLASPDEPIERTFTGTVDEPYVLEDNVRTRTRIGAIKTNPLGPAVTLTHYAGYDYTGFLSIPIPVNTDTVVNVSTYVGATQSDVNDAIKIEQGAQDTNISNNYALILANQSNISQNALDILRRTKPMGNYILNQQYEPYDQVLDQGYLAYALVQTAERPAPQLVGEPTNVYNGILTDQTTLAKQLLFGNRYSFDNGAFITAYSIYTTIDDYYVVYLVKTPLGVPIIEQLIAFTATTTGWQSFPISKTLISAGTVFDLVASVSKREDVGTTFNGTWNYSTPTNPVTPTAGQIIQSNKDLGFILVSKSDDTTDRSADLATLTVGDRLSALGATWTIQSIEDNGTYLTFEVNPLSQASPDGPALFTFEVTDEVLLESGVDVDYWITTTLPSGSAQGLIGADIPYSDIVPNDNAYGVNLEVQRATISDEWFIQSAPEGGSSGGTGSGIPDAPFTGDIFGRKDGVWTVVTVSTLDNIVATVAAGNIKVGETVPADSSLDDFINQLIAPVLGASITAQENVTITGISGGTNNYEIGSAYTNTGVSHSFSRGTIKNADGSGNVPLVGPELSYAFSGLSIDPVTGDIDYKVTSASVRWTVSNNFDEGTDPYYNSDGTVGSNIPASERAAGSDSANSGYVRGYYKYWYAVAAEGGTPINSSGVRGLSNYSWAVARTFGIQIAKGLREISIYIPDTMSVSSITYDESSGAPVLSTFAITTLTVNDGGGDPVNYKKYTQVVKATAGYPAIANYTVTIKTP